MQKKEYAFSAPEKRPAFDSFHGEKIAKTSAFTAAESLSSSKKGAPAFQHDRIPPISAFTAFHPDQARNSISELVTLPVTNAIQPFATVESIAKDPHRAPRTMYTALEQHPLTTIKASDGQEAVFFGRLDMSKVPERGNCKYAAQRFTGEDLQRLQSLSSKATPNEKTVLSDTRRFVDFLEANPEVESMGAALAQFAAQAAGFIGPGSAISLAKNVKGALLAARVETGSLSLCDAIIEGLQLTYAEEGAQHAVDISEAECKSWLSHEEPYRIRKVAARTMMWIMCTCGARCADILRAAISMQLDFAHGRLSATFAVTKTSRSVAEKRTVSFPFFCRPDPEIISFMTSSKWEEKLPDADALNAVLKKADLKKVVQVEGKEARSVTSYSFRRLFIHRVISWYTDDEGIVDWLKVIQWSGHKTDCIVSSTYSKGLVLSFPPAKEVSTPSQVKKSLLSQLSSGTSE